MIMGGLYAGNTTPMDDATKADIQQHWQHVHGASGQPFNHSFFQRPHFIYNTEPPCRAMIACHRQKPDSVLQFLHHLQQAFYVDNSDITDETVLIELAADFALDESLFKVLMRDPETQRITRLNFDYTRYLGVSGFPTLVAQSQHGNHFITRGYQSLQTIQPSIEQWLAIMDARDNPPSDNTGNPGE